MTAGVSVNRVYLKIKFDETILHYRQECVAGRGQTLKIIVLVFFGLGDGWARRGRLLVEFLVPLPRDGRQLGVEAGIAQAAVLFDIIGEHCMRNIGFTDGFILSVRNTDFKWHVWKCLGVRGDCAEMMVVED